MRLSAPAHEIASLTVPPLVTKLVLSSQTTKGRVALEVPVSEENSSPKPDPEIPNERQAPVNEQVNAANLSAVGETTLDASAGGAAAMAGSTRSIGRYLLVKILGEGGMGQVWLAEQTAPVKRQVALKLIKGGLYDSSVIQRFESERQSLAVMNHPAIAKVFDAGSTKDGQPYFVMEYVDGLPITRYCDSKKLKIRERLELFIRVCEGVQHAHQKAIIHRDLKPSNILVVEVDGKPVPRIIDFGLAKAVSPQLGGEQTQFTQAGAMVGTRGFMSPEQADPTIVDVDTRTDVYSLGVVLYVLLTGMLPFDRDAERRKPLDEVLRQLREEDPPTPSSKIQTEKESASAAAERRGTETNQLAKLLQGDLDWITMKAVEKDRARRYGTPSELAADIERYLENRPVVARPASTAYRVGKYVRRHRIGVSAAVGLALLLSGFIVTQTVELRRITEERDRTARERDRANRVTDFMIGMFKQSDPSKAQGNVTAREILDKASTDTEAALAKDPDLKAQMMDAIGKIYINLGLHDQAQALLEKAVDLRRSAFGLNDRQTLSSMFGLVKVFEVQHRYTDAENLARQTIDLQKRALGEADPDTLRTESALGSILYGETRFAESEKLFRETLEAQRRVLGVESKDTLDTMIGLATALEREGRIPEAMKSYLQLVEITPRVLGPDHPDTLMAIRDLAEAQRDTGHYAEAAKLQRRVLESDGRIYGVDNLQTATDKWELANTMIETGQFAEAEKIFRDVLDFRTRIKGPDARETLITEKDLAFVLGQEGRSNEAEKLQRQGLERAERSLGPDDRVTLIFMGDLAGSLGDRGQFAEAEKLLRRAREIQQRVLGPDSPDTATATYNLACIEARMGHRGDALTLLREAVDHGLLPKSDLAIEKDSDLKSLHGDPRFDALLAYAKERAAAAQKPN